jgi:hypothetical protein
MNSAFDLNDLASKGRGRRSLPAGPPHLDDAGIPRATRSRYMTLETFAPLSHDPIVRLPALVAR